MMIKIMLNKTSTHHKLRSDLKSLLKMMRDQIPKMNQTTHQMMNKQLGHPILKWLNQHRRSHSQNSML